MSEKASFAWWSGSGGFSPGAKWLNIEQAMDPDYTVTEMGRRAQKGLVGQ